MPASKRFSYLVPIVIFPNISAFPSARLKDCWRFWIMTWLSSLGRSDTPPSLACRKKQCGEMLRDNTRCHEIPGNLMCLSVVTSVLLSVVANGDWWRRGGKRRRRRWEWEWRRKKCTVINGHYINTFFLSLFLPLLSVFARLRPQAARVNRKKNSCSVLGFWKFFKHCVVPLLLQNFAAKKFAETARNEEDLAKKRKIGKEACGFWSRNKVKHIFFLNLFFLLYLAFSRVYARERRELMGKKILDSVLSF